eukprot:SAG31_NODE_40847_length_278_cov_10.039106_1_plen_76_part_10
MLILLRKLPCRSDIPIEIASGMRLQHTKFEASQRARSPAYLSPLVPPGPAVPKVVWTNHFQGQCQATLAAQGLQHQ